MPVSRMRAAWAKRIRAFDAMLNRGGQETNRSKLLRDPTQTLINRLTSQEHKRWARAGKPKDTTMDVVTAVWPGADAETVVGILTQKARA